MKTINIKYVKLWGVGMLVISLIICNTLLAQDKRPPIPKEPVTDLKMPEPVIFQEMKGQATIPKQVKLGFGLDIGNKVLVGNWDVKGRVNTVDAQKVSFITEEGDKGNLVFRLPKGLQLQLTADEPVTIKRISRGYKAALGYQLSVESKKRLVINSGRLFGDTPKRVRFPEGMTVVQSDEPGHILSRSKFETIYQIPVILITDTQKMPLTISITNRIKAGEKTYQVMISCSINVVPTKEYEGVAESSGYVLEYVVIPL